MKNATLTVTFNAEKLDALKFHMSRKDTDLQEELNDTVEKLYETHKLPCTRPVLPPVCPCVGFCGRGWHLYTLAGALRTVGRM